MMSNLLCAKEFPEGINVIQTNAGHYKDINKIVSGIPKHFKSKKLYFFGDPEEIQTILKKNGYTADILESTRIDDNSIPLNWDIIRVLFYRGIRQFLKDKGLFFYKGTAYMVNCEQFQETILIKKDDQRNYYTHEGFRYRLHFLNGSVFLSLTSSPVLTRNKYEDIITTEENQAFYNFQRYSRYNQFTREMLGVWIDFLRDGNGVNIPIPNDNFLVFNTNFENINENQGKTIQGGVTIDDFR